LSFKQPLSLLCWTLGTTFSWAVPSLVWAAGNTIEQRLAAEIMIMAGDARRLVQEVVPPLERSGLEQRLAGGIASLPLTLRRIGGDISTLSDLRLMASQRDWQTMLERLNDLQHRYPFDARRLLTAAPTREVVALGASIHRSTCAGCHESPGTADQLLPAKNLAAQMQSMPAAEFAARLWLGVRGTHETAYANPFSEAELAALIAWYRQPR
jgi:mono/diheme cytochrome c family protein